MKQNPSQSFFLQHDITQQLAFENVPTEDIPFKVTAKIFSDETNLLSIEELRNFEAKDYAYTIEDYNLSMRRLELSIVALSSSPK